MRSTDRCRRRRRSASLRSAPPRCGRRPSRPHRPRMAPTRRRRSARRRRQRSAAARGSSRAQRPQSSVLPVVRSSRTCSRDDPPSGPPTEAMSWSREPNAPAGLTLAGRTINHTWGVELLLDATGFEIGSAYRLVYVGVDGSRTDAGGFVGAELPMACRSNAPVLRRHARLDGDPRRRRQHRRTRPLRLTHSLRA